MLHRSTVWRQKNGRIKGSGLGRRSKAQEGEALALAAGVVDLIRETGACYAWQLRKVKRISYRDLLSEPKAVLDTSTELLRGSDATILAMKKSGLPVGLLLYTAAYIAHTRAGLEYNPDAAWREEKRHRASIKLITGTNPSGPATILATDTNGKLIRDKKGKLIRPHWVRPWDALQKKGQDSEDAKQRFDYGRGLDPSKDIIAEDDFRDDLDKMDKANSRGSLTCPTRSSKMGAIHKVPEFRNCGLSRQTCSKWRNSARINDALKLVVALLGGSLPSAVPSPLFRV